MQRLLATAAQLTQALTDVLADPARRDRAVMLLLAVNTVVWTIYASISTAGFDVHPDMAELVASSRELSLAYPKQPSLPVWVVTVWFAIFPRYDWAYYLLSFVNIGVALWFVWQIARRYLDREKAVVALALLTLTPVFTFHAIRFNANTLLIPLWAAATFTFLRSYEERTWQWGAWAGLAAALAVLGKGWSGFLILGFAAAIVADDKNRMTYLRSPALGATVLAGLVVLSPCLVWLTQHGGGGMSGPIASSVWTFVLGLGNYIIGGLLYVAVPVLIVFVAARPDREMRRDMLWPHGQRRRLMTVILWVSFLAPIIPALVLMTRLDALWTLGCWSLLPVLLLGSPEFVLNRVRANLIVAAAMMFPLVTLAGSPVVMVLLHKQGQTNYAAHGSLLVREAERHWRSLTGDKPLRYVAGTQELASAMAFYGRDKARAFPAFSPELAPRIKTAAMTRDGWVGLCAGDDEACLRNARALAAQSRNTRELIVDLPAQLLGMRGEVWRFVIVLAPPGA